MTDPTGGWADATGKASDTATEAIKAGRDLLSLISDPLRELAGIATDTLKVTRFKRQLRLTDQVKLLLREHGLNAPLRVLPPNFVIPLVEFASLEEDDDLQDIWALMLVNAADASSRAERRTAFVSMLKDMTAFDVMILAKIAKIAPSTSDGAVYTLNFPDSDDQADSGRRPAVLGNEVAVSLGNLARLGCINPNASYGGRLLYSHVTLTELGAAFVTACTSR
jgi:hypothetical protein